MYNSGVRMDVEIKENIHFLKLLCEGRNRRQKISLLRNITYRQQKLIRKAVNSVRKGKIYVSVKQLSRLKSDRRFLIQISESTTRVFSKILFVRHIEIIIYLLRIILVKYEKNGVDTLRGVGNNQEKIKQKDRDSDSGGVTSGWESDESESNNETTSGSTSEEEYDREWFDEKKEDSDIERIHSENNVGEEKD